MKNFSFRDYGKIEWTSMKSYVEIDYLWKVLHWSFIIWIVFIIEI